MTHDFDEFDDDALLNHLTAAAAERGERLSVGESEDEWQAAFLAKTPIGGEAVILSVNGPDRRTAMVRLADLVGQAG
jgi:hypothetical protein